MEQVLEFFRKLFDTSDWPPRWHCGNWTSFHGWLYILSDLLIWSAYFAIPLTILRYITRRSNTKFVRGYFLFAAFILACGSTHFLDAITFWFPAYRLNALVRLITGVLSWVTVFYIIRILPGATSLRPYNELEKEIREREKMEGELNDAVQQLNAAQEIAKVGHWEWDIPNNRLTWSRELYNIFGIDPQAATALGYDDFIGKVHPEDKDFVNESIREALASKQFPHFTHRIVLNDGTTKILQARGDIITDAGGNITRMIGTGQDITEQQKAQQQLVERTHELELSNAELQKFAYVASHDLQEPLRKILTFTSLLERELADPGERGKLYMEKIKQASNRMQKLIEDILQFSSIRAERAAFLPVDLNAVIRQVLSDIEVQVEQTGAQVSVDVLPVVEAVASQMGQLFLNLLSNALKFRRDGVPPVVRITGQQLTGAELQQQFAEERNLSVLATGLHWERDAFIRLTVQDNGIGFNETYAEKVFEIFQRLHDSAYSGTGIGLAICKKIVDNHHGIIQAHSPEGAGACFVIVLPLSQKRYLDGLPA